MESKKPEVTQVEVPVVGTTPKDGDFTPKEKREIKELVLKVAGTFLVGEDALQELRGAPKESFLQVLQEKYEEELRRYYKESGLHKGVQDLVASYKGDSLDVEILQLVGKASDGDEPWVDMLTKLRDQYPKAGMNCTLASAMLHLALDDVGQSDGVHTASCKGHALVLRELSDGGLRIYDPTQRRANELGEYQSSLLSVTGKDVETGPAVDEGFGRSGHVVTVDGLKGGRTARSYAYDSKTVLSVAITLSNLALISVDAMGGKTRDESRDPKDFPAILLRRKRAKELCEQFPELNRFSEVWKLIKPEFFDYAEHL